MSSKYLLRTLVAFLAVVVLCLIVLVRLPIASLVSWDEYQISATDIDRSTIFSGEMYLEFAQAPTLGRVLASWRWCPGAQIMSWCMELQARDLEFDGRVSLGMSSVSIRTADAQMASLLPLGIDPSLAGLQASVQIEELIVTDLSCPAGSLTSLIANAGIAEIRVFGSSLGDANLTATAENGVAEASLTGDRVSGSFESSSTLDFSGVFAVVPTPDLEPLFRQFAQPDANGEFQWQASGRLPCGWG